MPSVLWWWGGKGTAGPGSRIQAGLAARVAGHVCSAGGLRRKKQGIGWGGTGRPRLALCGPSKHSLPHPTTPFLLQPHLPLLTFLTVILYFENVI